MTDMPRSTLWLVLLWLWLSVSLVPGTQAERLCSLPPPMYARAKQEYPAYASALREVEQRGVAVWLADGSHQDVDTMTRLLVECDESSRLVVVVNGFQLEETNRRRASLRVGDGVFEPDATFRSRYDRFVTRLKTLLGSRRVLFVLEPGAVERMVSVRGERQSVNFTDELSSLETAARMLSENPNAKLYIDVAAELLEQQESARRAAAIFSHLARVGNVAGIALNSADERRTTDLVGVCDHFQRSVVKDVVDPVHCVIDTSRSHWRQTSSSRIRLNGEAGVPDSIDAGLGEVPSAATGYANVDYFIWTQTPGAPLRRTRLHRHTGTRALTASMYEDGSSSSYSTSSSTPAAVSSVGEEDFDIGAFGRLWANSELVLAQSVVLDVSASDSSSGEDAVGSVGAVVRAAGSSSQSLTSASLDQADDERAAQPDKRHNASHHHHSSSWSSDDCASCGGSDGSASGSMPGSDNNTITTVAPTSIPTPVPEASKDDSPSASASAMASSADTGSADDDTGSGMSVAQMILIAGLALAGTVTVVVVFVVDWSHCSQRPSETGSYGVFEVYSNRESRIYSL